jgi:hypothetical protein
MAAIEGEGVGRRATSSARPVVALAIVALTFLCVRAPGAKGQPDMSEQRPVIEGVLRPRQIVSTITVGSACPAFVSRRADELFERTSKVLSAVCRATASSPLGMADGARWQSVIYERTLIVTANSAEQATTKNSRDTTVQIAAVLASTAPARASWSAEWIDVVERDITYSLAPTIATLGDGSLFVAIRYCINGTGGCWQEFMHRRAAHWTGITQAYWKQIPPIRDGQIGKGPGIDVHSLRGNYGVYADRDANCCPGRDITVILELRNDSLLLRSSKVQRLPP